MKIVVPLAGPDFIRSDGTVKALDMLDGQPLLKRVLDSRPWAKNVRSNDYAFVLKDAPETRDFVFDHLLSWYPNARVFYISDDTRGAALSALVGMAAYSTPTDRLIVDLADILYDSSLDPDAMFDEDDTLGGIALTFSSQNPIYSYLETDRDGTFIRAAEKVVISNNASAGTYLYASTPIYLRAVAHALENEITQTHANLFFACPLFNGIVAQGKTVAVQPVTNVQDIKIEG